MHVYNQFGLQFGVPGEIPTGTNWHGRHKGFDAFVIITCLTENVACQESWT